MIQRKYLSDKEVLEAKGKLEAPRFSSYFGGYIRVLGPDTLRHQLIEEQATGKHYIYDRVADKYESATAGPVDDRDPIEFLEEVVPEWASVHRAMELEAEQFTELQAGPIDDKARPWVIYGERDKRDQDVIIDLACRKTCGGGAILHLGQFRGELIGGALFFRVYLTIMEHHPLQTNVEKGLRYTRYKEVKQLASGELLITGMGENGSPDADKGEKNPSIYFNVGRPMRAYAWAAKYAEQDRTSTPTVRAFLVPFEPMLALILRATREDEKSTDGTRIQSSDYERTGGQFGIGGTALTTLRKIGVAGSLITYSDHITTLDKESGVLQSLSALGALAGIPDVALARSGFTTDGAVGFRATRINPEILALPERIQRQAMQRAVAARPSSLVANELQRVVAHWFGNARLLPDGTAMGDRAATIRGFLEEHAFAEVAIVDALAAMT